MSDESKLAKVVRALDHALAQQGRKTAETFPAARARILRELESMGWTVSAHLKIPHATSPDGLLRLWFKPQAVWLSVHDRYSVGSHELKQAHTLDYDHDIRRLTTAQLIARAEARARR